MTKREREVKKIVRGFINEAPLDQVITWAKTETSFEGDATILQGEGDQFPVLILADKEFGTKYLRGEKAIRNYVINTLSDLVFFIDGIESHTEIRELDNLLGIQED